MNNGWSAVSLSNYKARFLLDSHNDPTNISSLLFKWLIKRRNILRGINYHQSKTSIYMASAFSGALQLKRLTEICETKRNENL